MQPFVPTLRPGMFCAPVMQLDADVIFLEDALVHLTQIEGMWKQSAARDESIKNYLASLSVSLSPQAENK